MPKVDPLIRTKLRRPFTRLEFVPRLRLQAQIVQGLKCPLTLVTAPAGFGKTTLIASYLDDIVESRIPPARVAWLSLDKDDNQEGRFLSYVTAALQEVDPEIGKQAAQILAVQQSHFEAIQTSLINDLDAAAHEVVLVLDDYHFIHNQAVHNQVEFFLEHCPKTFHLVILTRSDPPLPITRLRARCQLVEIRAADLRFTPTESTQFLNRVMGIGLDEPSVALLTERTEGWIAGLQMAALALIGARNIHSQIPFGESSETRQFIARFSGTNRYILDYLLEEVLAGQPPEIQHFLLATSILDRLSASLCKAVVNDNLPVETQPFSHHHCQEILEYLEHANIFLVPLDDERTWYRYHHLFADLLRAQLEQSIGEVGVIQLHCQASTWYEHNGPILDAIYHASLAKDFERIETLIRQNYSDMMNHGEMTWVRLWLGKLSKEFIIRRPWLCLYEAGSKAWFGQLDEANFWLEEAEKQIQPEISLPTGDSTSTALPPVEARTLRGYHAYLKSRVTAMRGDTRRAITICSAAREDIPASNLGLQIDLSIALGYQYFLVGDFALAEQTLTGMIQLGAGGRAVNNPVAGYAILARMRAYQGQLHAASALLQKAARLVQEADGQHLGVNGLIEVEEARLCYERNDLSAALEHLNQGLDFLPLWGKADDFALAWVEMSKVQLARGNRQAAAEAVEKAVQWIQTCGTFSEARNVVEMAQVRLWLREGSWTQIERWMAGWKTRLGSRDPERYEDELPRMALARVLMEQNRLDDAIQLLEHMANNARPAGRNGRLIDIFILQVLARLRESDQTQIEDAFLECLALAEPEGYARTFLDEGPPMQFWLAKIIKNIRFAPFRAYILRLLSQFEDDSQKTAAVLPSAARRGGTNTEAAEPFVVVPLSRRELEVLQRMAQGKTNQAIAEEFVLSLGTVKTHAASIYRKLDAANRTEAVARARQIGLLP